MSGCSTFDEPFTRLLTQGMVLKNGAVMSKSKGNVVDPDDMLAKYGADALRLYVMFVAPPEKEVEWSDAGLEGSFRFLLRVWRLVDHWAETIGGEGMPACGADCTDAERALRRKTHETIRRVTVDIEERMHLNTAVSSLMELVNELYAFSEQTPHGAPSRGEPPVGRIERAQTLGVLREAIDALVLMLSPFAPHTAEELWHMLGHAEGWRQAAWPAFDPDVAKAEVVVPVQINGKVRARLTVDAGSADDAAARAGAGRCGRAARTPTARRFARSWWLRDRWYRWCHDDVRRSTVPGVPWRSRRDRLLVGALAVAGAAIRWPGAGRFCRPTSRRLACPPFVNRTTVFNLETQLTAESAIGVHRPRQIHIVPEADNVDAVLTGEVMSVTPRPPLRSAAAGDRATRSG